MEWKAWSSLPLTQREQLPTKPGIYVVVDAEEQVWYVGQSVNLNARWKARGHHRYQQLSRTNNKRLYKIYWQFFPSEQLNEKEQLYIDLFKPYLNYSRVKTYARKATQPDEELSLLLKVLNKKTMLFPDVRSVVIGYYIEIDEDEEGKLKEYTCIVTAVNVNDHDGPILNSYSKSHSKKGKNLKGCWYTYESKCGSDNPDIKPALIPVFVLGDVVYEFVCYPGLIEMLAQKRSNLYNLEIAGQPVLALRDTDILSSLIFTEGHFAVTSEAYLHYRAIDIRPVMELLSEMLSA